MAIVSSFCAAHRIRLFYDPDAQPVPEKYHIFIHGIDTAFIPVSGATIGEAWAQVLDHVQMRRGMIRRDKHSLLDPNGLCTIYAGSLAPGSLEALRTSHMREHMLEQLHRIAGRSAENGSGRLQAIALLSKLYGINR